MRYRYTEQIPHELTLVIAGCWSKCMRESNAAQTACTGEEMKSCKVKRTAILSISTLMEKSKPWHRFSVALNQKWVIHKPSKVGHVFLRMCDPLRCNSTSSDEVSVSHKRLRFCRPEVLKFTDKSPEGIPSKGSFFWQALQKCIREESACTFASRATGFSLNKMRESIRCTAGYGQEGNN